MHAQTALTAPRHGVRAVVTPSCTCGQELDGPARPHCPRCGTRLASSARVPVGTGGLVARAFAL
jgi:hypothetical protein